ncbi:uncharacterized protein LTR77_006746 [Saxophila tyrrhenica]|uniref:Cytochrome P450 n=1 Tax=Saxophila tyrrhenica TaxID=1690608 RepID=A0AAV9P8K8_9PEZI|nr:hypothetical protein LTR77_006746 [Saxophila tyrrhenica]
MAPLNLITSVLLPANLPTLSSLAIATLLVAPLAWVIYTRFFHPLAKFPGPFAASVTRWWYVREVGKGNFDKTHRKLHARYGPIVRIAPNEVTISDASAVQTIYGIKSKFTKTDWYDVWRGPNRGTKHFDQFTDRDEKHHAARRRLLSNMYSMTSVLESEPYIDDCSEVLMRKLSALAERGVSIDLGKWLQMYAFDVIGELYFGSAFGFLEAGDDPDGWIETLDESMPARLDVANMSTMWRRPYDFLKSLRMAHSDGAKRFADMAAWVDDRVNERHRLLGAGDLASNVNTSRKDMLAKLFELRDTKGEKEDFNTADVQQEGWVGTSAGSDTTAIAMRAIVHQLLTHPEALRRVRAELESAMVNGGLSLPVKFSEAQQNLPFFCACIKEAMRLHPSVGLTMPRLVPAGGSEVAGQFFPEGTTVGINPAVLHYDPSIFGSDAAEFNPDRWLSPNASGMDRFLLTFGGGTRTCIGKNISLAEVHKMLPTLFMTFDMELTHERPWESHDFWFNKQTGLDVKLSKRTVMPSPPVFGR